MAFLITNYRNAWSNIFDSLGSYEIYVGHPPHERTQFWLPQETEKNIRARIQLNQICLHDSFSNSYIYGNHCFSWALYVFSARVVVCVVYQYTAQSTYMHIGWVVHDSAWNEYNKQANPAIHYSFMIIIIIIVVVMIIVGQFTFLTLAAQTMAYYWVSFTYAYIHRYVLRRITGE